MVKKKFTASIIGVGRIGFSLGFDKRREQPASHTFALKENKNIEIVSACDTDKKKLEFWKRHNKKCNVYDKSCDFFKKEISDIIVVSVNESSHLEVAIEAIKKQPKLIILEKPVAPNLKQALLIKKYSNVFIGIIRIQCSHIIKSISQ